MYHMGYCTDGFRGRLVYENISVCFYLYEYTSMRINIHICVNRCTTGGMILNFDGFVCGFLHMYICKNIQVCI